jgi:putative DNA primase/helicase
MRRELHDEARRRWKGILPLLGLPASSLDGKQHPCPVCGGKDRFRFDDIDGDGTWYCNQCGAGNGMSLAMKLLGLPFADMAVKVRELLPDANESAAAPKRDEAKCRDMMRDVWSKSLPMAGTMAEAYLRSRGCWSDTLRDHVALRFVTRLRANNHEAEYLPAMVAKVTDAAGAGVNIHRTFLFEGRKAYRAMMPGAVPKGAAVRLFAASPHIGIAEGIETALCASNRFRVPCWSAVTAGGLETWEPPTGTERVEICGDTDESYTGQAVAYALARKLTNRREPIRCAVNLPPEFGLDWADVDTRSSIAA